MSKRVRIVGALLLVSLLSSCSVIKPGEVTDSVTNEETAEPIPSISSTVETTVESEASEISVNVNWDSYVAPTPVEVSDDNIYTRLSEDYIYKYTPGTAEGYLIPFVGYSEGVYYASYGNYYGFADETGKIVCDAHYSSMDYVERYSLWIARDLTNDECDIYSADGTRAITFGYNDVYFYQDKIYCFTYSYKDDELNSGIMSVYDLNFELVEEGVEFPCDGSSVFGVIDETHLLLYESNTDYYLEGTAYYLEGTAYVDLESKELITISTRRTCSTFCFTYEDKSAYYNNSTESFIVFKSNGCEYSDVCLIEEGFYFAYDDSNTYFIDAEGNILNQLDYMTNVNADSPMSSLIGGKVYILDREGILRIFDKRGNLERTCDLNGVWGRVDKVINDHLIAVSRTKYWVVDLDTGEVVFEFGDSYEYSSMSSYLYFYDSNYVKVYDDEFNSVFCWPGIHPNNLISINDDHVEQVGLIRRASTAEIYSLDGQTHIADVPVDDNTYLYYCFDSRTVMCFGYDVSTTIYDSDGNIVFRYVPAEMYVYGE